YKKTPKRDAPWRQAPRSAYKRGIVPYIHPQYKKMIVNEGRSANIRSGRQQSQLHDQMRALPGAGVEIHPPAMIGDDGLQYGQAQARALDFLAGYAKELVEDPVVEDTSDPRPLVDDLDARPAAADLPQAQHHGRKL